MREKAHVIVGKRSPAPSRRRVTQNNRFPLTMPQTAQSRRASAQRVPERSQLRSSDTALRPPLKWAGGKRWQVPHLRPFWEPHRQRRLVEPFCGGLAVACSLTPQLALLNDVNPHIVNFYQWLKRGLKTDVAMENDETVYYANRSRFNELLSSGRSDTAEAAGALLLPESHRVQRPVPVQPTRGSSTFLSAATNGSTIAGTSLSTPRDSPASSSQTLISRLLRSSPTDFVYADPPYDVAFRNYSKGGFGWEEQVRTAEWLAKHPGPVMLSNQATDRILKLYRKLGYRLHPLTAPRLISCTGDRTPAEEVLATRNL